MSIAVFGGATHIEASLLSYHSWREFQTCMEGNGRFDTSDFTTPGIKRESDFCVQRLAYLQPATSYSEGVREEKSAVGLRADSGVAAEKDMPAEPKSNAFDSVATASAADVLAFEGFEINTADEAERTAVLRALSEATWQQQDDGEIKAWTKRPAAEENSTEEEAINLVDINSNGSFFGAEPSSLSTWLVVGLCIAAAIYLERRKHRLAK